MDHLHFFLGVVIFKENVDVGQAVEGNAVGVGLVFGIAPVEEVAHLALQLFNTLLPGARNRLIGGNNHAPDFGRIVQGLERHHHLDGGAVGIGDDAVMVFQGLGVDFGHHQGAAVIHAPCGGVVHHDAAGMGRMGGKF